ncbi:MAG TPA: DUF2946 family protein [Caulobacteraceae bacterium]|nr:DUF2946 family protein [Caulobacteraceae bacterium]
MALVLNVLVPPGFMAGGQGAHGLVLCTGHGPVMIASDLDGLIKGSGSHDSKSNAGGPCAFTGHGAPPPLAAAPVLASLAVSWSFVPGPVSASVAVPSLAAPPPPSRGPPTVLI